MSFKPLTKEQYQEARKKFSHEQIMQFEDKRKRETPLISGPDEDFLLGIPKAVTDFGVGVGTTIGKAGLGLGEASLRGVGEIARVTGGERGKKVWTDVADASADISKALYGQKQFVDSNKTLAGGAGQLAGNAALYLAPSSAVQNTQSAVTGALGNIAKNAPRAGLPGFLTQSAINTANVFGRALPEAVSAGVVNLAQSGGKDLEGARNAALLAGGLSVGLQTVAGTANAVKDIARTSKTAKDVLSNTSGVPRGAIETASKFGVNKNATPEQAVESVRNGVKEYRGMLSKYWDAKITGIIDEFTGSRVGLTDDLIARYTKVADEFGIDPKMIPKDLRNMSVKEMLTLMKGVNELDSLAVTMSPKGAIVRQLKPELKDLATSAFGGKEGSLAKLWSDYSAKKQIFDSAENIVKAYKVNSNPTTAVTAKNKLMAIFDENKPEYLKAIQDLERELGKTFTKDIASTKFQELFPTRIAKADGGLPIPREVGFIEKGIQTATLPISSPRSVGSLVSPSTKTASDIGMRVFGTAVPQASDDIIVAGMQMKMGAPLNTIASHVNTSKQVLENMSKQDIFNNGGIPFLLERTKTNIVDQLANEGSKAVSEAIKKIDTSTLGSLDELVAEIAKII